MSSRLGKPRKNRNPDGTIMREVAGVMSDNKPKVESDAVVEHSAYVASSSQKQLVASASLDKTIRLWEVGTGLCCSTLKGHSDSASAVAFSPDGQLVASASYDKTVRLWEVATGLCLSTLKGHSEIVLAVTFSPDGQLVATASYDKTVRLWEAATGLCRSTLKGHSEMVLAVTFSPDGQLVASASYDKTVRLWEAATGSCRSTLEGHSSHISDVAFSPDGQLVASASYDKTARLWEAATGLCLSTLKGHSEIVLTVTFSPDGQLVASASYDKTVRLWEAATGSCRSTLEGHSSYISAVAFSPDGQLIASASNDKTVRLWEVATGSPRSTLEGHSDLVKAVAFSPDGQLVASASYDKTVRLWDTATGSYYRTLTLEGHTESLSAVAFSIPQNERGATKPGQGRTISRESTHSEDKLDKPLSPCSDTTCAEEKDNFEPELKLDGLPETETSPERPNERPDVFGHELTISIDDSTYPEMDPSYGRSTLSERRERRLSRESMHSRDRQPSTSGRWRSVRPRSPPSRPQSYYGPPLSFPTKTSRNSRPSSIMSAGSNDSGFGEGVFDLPSHRRSNTTFQPPTNYHYTAPPAYIHNPYYPTYLPAVNYSSVMYDGPMHLSPIPQSSRLSLPSTLPTHNPLTPLSSISPSFQNWPHSALDSVDVTKHPDYEKCSKLFADADFYHKGELTAAEVRIVFVQIMPLHQNVIENLVRLFAIRNTAKEKDPPLNFTEFFSLWRYCKEWSAIFRTADADKNGRISHLEFRIAFGNWDGFGYQLSPNILKESLRTFDRRGNEALGLDLESFLNICIGLKRITDEFDRDQERTWKTIFLFEKYALGM
jgi:WD40 repeat protein